MKYCDCCGVKVDSAYARCPLCHKEMGKPEGELPYPAAVKKPVQKKRLTMQVRILFALTVFAIGISVLINLALWRGVLWSMMVTASSLYAWLLIAGTMMSPWYNGAKVLLQVAGTSVLLLAVQLLTPQKDWAQNYVIPFIIITATIIEIFYTYEYRKRWRESMVYVFIVIIIGFIPLILLWAGLINVWWPAAACAFMAGFTLIGFILFAVKQFKNEITKRFHL